MVILSGQAAKNVRLPMDDVTRRLGQIEQRVSVHFDVMPRAPTVVRLNQAKSLVDRTTGLAE